MSVRTACPFCNSQVIEPAEVPRVVCPRCGESFEPAAWEPTAETLPTASATSSPFPVRALYVYLSLTMSLVAVICAIGYYKPWVTTPAPVAPLTGAASTIPPTALSGLRYIPASANVVVALQPAAMVAFHPTAQFRTLGLPEGMIAVLEKTGLTPEKIEQIVAGLSFAIDKPIPALTVVLKLRQPVDEEKMLDALRAEKKPIAGRPVYTTKMSMLLATKIDDRTWLFGFDDKDFALADQPAVSPAHFADSVNTAIRELEPSSYAWLVTERSRKWSESSPLLQAAKPLAAKLSQVQQASASLSFDREPLTRVSLLLIDAATAREVEKYLKQHLPDATVTVTDNSIAGEIKQQPAVLFDLVRGLMK